MSKRPEERRFEIVREVARGGMGRVVKARDRSDGSFVAMKLVQTPSIDATARFAREARMLEMAQHPSCVRLIDHGMLVPEGPFLAMEWIEGPTVEAVLRAHAAETNGGRAPVGMPIAEVVAVALRVASALVALEARGIVHRDVKALNVMLPDGDARRATLVDFGAARSEHEKIRLTLPGSIVGTPNHFAPEQAEGDMDVSPPLDVWGLGILLFHMLTGTMPFESERMITLMVQIVTGDVPSLIERRPDCPGALTSLVHRCLAKEAERRPRAEEVLHELVEFACGTSGDRTSALLEDVGFRRSILLDERDTWVDPNAAPKAMLEHKSGPK